MNDRDKELKRRFQEAYARVSRILFEEDPIGINFETNTDEYKPEAGTIVGRLGLCRSTGDVRRVLHEEFTKWFDADTAGPAARYEATAKRIWNEVVPGLSDR